VGIRVHALRCANCGAPVEDPKEQRCSFCGVYLLRLSRLELATIDGKVGVFRSLRPLYLAFIAAAVLSVVLIYFVFFDSLSETLLVRISPIWFLLGVVGTCGLYTEKAVKLVLAQKAETLQDGLIKGTASLPLLLRLLVGLIFVAPRLLINLNKTSSPFWITTTTTAVWAALLYLFLVGIFPAL